MPFVSSLLPAYAVTFSPRQRAERAKLRRAMGVRSFDVFLWAVAIGAWPLARLLWRWTDNPMRSALAAASMCRRMAETAEMGFDSLTSRAEEFEAMARGVLDHISSEVALGDVGVRYLTLPDRSWRLSLLEFAHTTEMKSFLSHSHCRALVSAFSHQTSGLALPHHATSGSILWQAVTMPFGRSTLLDACTDLRQRNWRRSKRHLSMSLYRRDAPPPLRGCARAIEFFCVPRVKLVLRHSLSVAYTLLFAALLVNRADADPFAAALARRGPSGFDSEGDGRLWTTPLIFEAFFLWWSFNLLVDRYASSRRRLAAFSLRPAAAVRDARLGHFPILLVASCTRGPPYLPTSSPQ